MQSLYKESIQSSWNCVKDQYILLEKVGEGSYGEVKKAIHKASMSEVAIKKISLPDTERISTYKSVIREITILRKLSKHNSNIFSVRLVDVIVPEEEMKANKIKSIFLVMDFYEDSL